MVGHAPRDWEIQGLNPAYPDQWLKTWDSSGYPARDLVLLGQPLGGWAWCQYPVPGWDSMLDAHLLSQSGSRYNWDILCMLLGRSVTKKQAYGAFSRTCVVLCMFLVQICFHISVYLVSLRCNESAIVSSGISYYYHSHQYCVCLLLLFSVL